MLRKGNFLDPGDVVAPGVPASLHAFPAGAPPDRLGLARWLTDRRNPLTARVAVNRLWSQIFATGLVETEEDFGTQGEPPSHPELLDWLAIFYQDSGWDTKALLRLIVTSATYRQSSKVTARAPRARSAQPLAGAGAADAARGRDGARPGDGLKRAAARGSSAGRASFLLSPMVSGRRRSTASAPGRPARAPDRYRRGLYTFWRRTVPYPSMAAFDAPSREICAIKRVRTNTPLQSFVTMNDPVYVEAARALARRIVREGGPDVRARVRFGLHLCLCRRPEPEQIEPLVALFDAEYRAISARSPGGGESIGRRAGIAWPAGTSAAELAAWTTVANVLLNLDGVLTKG